ncbi:SIMPL domain-containing protein [Natrialbaceae archaeon A-chndr2]|uniref:SIMPL domain-containing protein n=1 Tax=Natronosalvus amylolyticus TaxID=2961994 RepID=UPI0020C94908|nr:SIMPL domain-containing protein [Natronosalvus amylolyticus]
MNRRTVLIGAATAATTATAGCLGTLAGDDGNSDPGSNSATGHDDTEGSRRTIKVSGVGEVSTDPDLARIQAGIQTTGDSAAAVRNELAERGDALYDALVEFGLEEDDITTGRYDIRRRIDRRRMEREGADPQSEDDLEEYVYYQGTSSFRIEVREIDRTGEVVDAAVDAGADDIGRIEFTLSDEKRAALREDALENALTGARDEATFIAREVDSTLVEAKHVDSSGGDVTPVYDEVTMEDDVADDARETQLHPDEVTVSARVEVTYTIE